MTKQIKTALAIGLILVAAAAVVLLTNLVTIPDYSSFFTAKTKEIEPSKATGSVDVAVDSLINDSLSEKMLLQDEEKDADLIGLDSQEIGDVNNIYDESEF